MHHITSVTVDGFWETYTFKFDLFKDVTFFIGPNGTGKTTLINIIASVLTADIANLEKLPFQKITIILSGNNNNNIPSISVHKNKKGRPESESIEYRIKSGTGGKDLVLNANDETDLFYRHLAMTDRFAYEQFRRQSSKILPAIRQYVNVTWLSVHRSPVAQPSEEYRPSFDSSVDRKLEDQSNALVRYFATLSGEKDKEFAKFQEFMFTYMLETFNDNDVLSHLPNINLRNLDNYKSSLKRIFGELHVPEDNSGPLIDSYFSKVEKFIDRPPGAVSPQVAFSVLALSRIDTIVNRWRAFQEKIDKVYSQRDRFREIINTLLQRKQMLILSSNELQFRSRTGKVLNAQMLSSGEKQLLILLSEALLQREMPAIFIADEPELSLHVLWQERLIASLRAINPSAQIIAATHSPDIVGPLVDQAIDMETLIP
ncbi:AAA family ATPase [Xanthobacteraceae bacterium A53D]